MEINDRNTQAHDPNDFSWMSGKKRNQPANEFHALMESKPFDEPEISIEEAHVLRELLADAIDSLPEKERWLFEVLFVAKLSLRFVARVLDIPKTTLARRRDALLAQLRLELEDNPIIKERLK